MSSEGNARLIVLVVSTCNELKKSKVLIVQCPLILGFTTPFLMVPFAFYWIS